MIKGREYMIKPRNISGRYLPEVCIFDFAQLRALKDVVDILSAVESLIQQIVGDNILAMPVITTSKRTIEKMSFSKNELIFLLKKLRNDCVQVLEGIRERI